MAAFLDAFEAAKDGIFIKVIIAFEKYGICPLAVGVILPEYKGACPIVVDVRLAAIKHACLYLDFATENRSAIANIPFD